MKRITALQYLVWAFLPLFLFVCSRDSTVGPKNKPPSAYLSMPSRAFLNRPVKVHAEAQDDGSIIQYAWRFSTAPWVVTSGADTTITMPSSPQQYLCSLKVTDNGGLVSYDRQIIYVESAAPILKLAQQSLNAYIYDTVRIYATASDSADNGRVVDFEWKFGYSMWKSVKKMVVDSVKHDTSLVSDTLIQMPSTPQIYVCSLRVTDNDGIRSYSRVLINVMNKTVTALAAADPAVTFMDAAVKLIGKAITTENDSIVEWAWKVGAKAWNVTQKDTIIKPQDAGVLVCSLRVTNAYGMSSKASVSITVKQSDLIAIADADPKVTFINSPVHLIGKASSSTNDSIIEWAWKIGMKPWTVGRNDTIFKPEQVGTMVCSLRVLSAVGTSAKAAVAIVVNQPNIQAVADADPKVIYVNGSVKLFGTASVMPNDSIVEWAWKIGVRPWRVSNKDTTITPDEVGSIACSLRVTDVFGIYAKSVVTITVKPANIQAIAGSNVKTGLNDPVQLHGLGLPEDQILLYRWKIHSFPWKIAGKDTVIVSASSEQTWLCSLEVTDKYGQTAKDGFVLYSKSQPPLAKATVSPAIVPVNGKVLLKGEGTDEEGIIQYEWKAGSYPWRESPPDTLITVPSLPQLYRCSLKVVDRDFEVAYAFVDVRVTSNPVIAYAGEDTIVSTDSDFKLHGQELSGTSIGEWWWKIDKSGMWRRTATSDTLIHTSTLPTTLVCSLRVVTTNNTEGFDEVIIYVKNVANNRIVYSKADGSIYTNSLNFDTEEQLSVEGTDPKWSPDGQRIAFTRQVNGEYYIYCMDWNGNNVRQLGATVGGMHPSWYNDNQTLVYGRNYNNRYSVYKINSNGTGNQELFFIENRRVEEPVVNPTNQDEIAFLNSALNTTADSKQIYVHSSSGIMKIKGNSSNRTARYNLQIYGERLLWDAVSNNTNYLQSITKSDTSSIIAIESNSSFDLRSIFSRDGNSLYFIHSASANTTFYQCDLFGNSKQSLNTISGKVENFDIK
ncbi:MAG: PKD domain-containing protein [Chitinivibrionales bacterium]|nr:PKD domain-containing protein [Chitinivibrionales bacterium]